MLFHRHEARLERNLARSRAALQKARDDEHVAAMQLAALAEQDDEARVRALVSDNVADEKNWRASHRHAETMQAALTAARERVKVLETAVERAIEELASYLASKAKY